jgi:hypothetical protein
MAITEIGLIRLGEACGQLSTATCKKLASLLNQVNEERHLNTELEDEIADIIGASALVIENLELDSTRIYSRAELKLNLFQRWCEEEMKSSSKEQLEVPIAWMSADGATSITNAERQSWIDSGSESVSEKYSIPLKKI